MNLDSKASRLRNRLILFTSYYFATKTERVLLQEGLSIKLIATPPQLSNCCGLCILISEEELDKAKELMEQHKITYTNIYTYDEHKKRACPSI